MERLHIGASRVTKNVKITTVQLDYLSATYFMCLAHNINQLVQLQSSADKFCPKQIGNLNLG